MNWVDFVMLGFLGAFLIYGITRGFVRQIAGIVGVVAALIVAARYGPVLAEARLLDGFRARNPLHAAAAAYLAVFFAVALFSGLVVAAINRLAPPRNLKAADSFFGAVVGALQAVLLLGGVSIALLEGGDPLAAPVKASVLAPRFAEGCKAIVGLVPDQRREESGRGIERRKEAVEGTLTAPGGDGATPAGRRPGG